MTSDQCVKNDRRQISVIKGLKNSFTDKSSDKSSVQLAPTAMGPSQSANWATPGTLPPVGIAGGCLSFHATMSDEQIKEECGMRVKYFKEKHPEASAGKIDCKSMTVCLHPAHDYKYMTEVNFIC